MVANGEPVPDFNCSFWVDYVHNTSVINGYLGGFFSEANGYVYQTTQEAATSFTNIVSVYRIISLFLYYRHKRLYISSGAGIKHR